MASYDVYGLGNALLDIECEVTPETLSQLGIDKGVMTLLDETAQNNILAHLSGQTTKRSSGGSAANTLIGVSQFGGKAYYSCKVADDESGQFYLQDLVDCGVETNLQKQPLGDGITGKCLVLVTPDADRTMNTFLGISATLAETELDGGAIANSAYTYIEGYLVTGESGKAAAIKARELAQAAGQKVALTLADLNMVKFFKAGLLEMIGDGLDLLFANESEALEMAGTEDFETAFEYLKTLAKTFAITRGPAGSVMFDGENRIEIAGVPVKAVDTVGAGDMYAGAVLYGITNGLGWETAGKLGSAASAKLVTSLGARLQTEQSQAVLAQVLAG